MKRKIPNVIIKLAKTVAKLPKEFHIEPRSYIVGGFVRDLLQNKLNTDIDIEVYGVSYPKLLSTLHSLFPDNVMEVGKSFGVCKVKAGKYTIDIALPRSDSKIGNGHTGIKAISNPDLLPSAALKRRDFTINAILLDPLTKKIIDPYGGQVDLKKRILRAVNLKTFPEDPLRAYRALQFSARFTLSAEPKTKATLKRMITSGDLSTLSRERVTAEWIKLLLASSPHVGLRLAQEIKLLSTYFPELSSSKANTWNNSLKTVESAATIISTRAFPLKDEEKIVLMLVAMLRGVTITQAQNFLSKFTFSSNVKKSVLALITHQHVLTKVTEDLKIEKTTEQAAANTLRKTLRDIAPTSWCLLYALSQTPKQDAHTGDVFKKLLKKYNLESESKKLLMSGQNILEEARRLKVQIHGNQIGELIKAIEKKRDLGIIWTKPQARKQIRSILGHEPR